MYENDEQVEAVLILGIQIIVDCLIWHVNDEILHYEKYILHDDDIDDDDIILHADEIDEVEVELLLVCVDIIDM